MDLFWNKTGQEFHLETRDNHVVGTVQKRGDQFIAGVAIPYTNKDGVEQDWKEHDAAFNLLHEATEWVEENARWTVQGEFLNFLNIKTNL